jgi:ribosomal protein S18 acetylase RimI-like enzyme
MAEAARLCDAVAHRWAGGRWLSTGGGGYAAYRVVPRAWSLVWLAGAHREVPASIPDKWRERWAGDAARFGDDPLPSAFLDEPNGGLAADYAQEAAEERSVGTVALAERIGLPVLVREAIARGWFDPLAPVAVPGPTAPPSGSPTVVRLEPGALDRLTVAPRVIAPADPSAVQALLSSAKNVDASVTAAVAGAAIVGLVVSAPSRPVPAADELLAVGVAPAYRGDGLGSSMLRAHLDDREGGRPMVATFTVAERDPVEPLEAATRAAIARRLLESAGFRVRTADPPLGAADPWAVTATLQGDVGGVSRRG